MSTIQAILSDAGRYDSVYLDNAEIEGADLRFEIERNPIQMGRDMIEGPQHISGTITINIDNIRIISLEFVAGTITAEGSLKSVMLEDVLFMDCNVHPLE